MWRHLESNRDIDDEGGVFEISAKFSQLCKLTTMVKMPNFKYKSLKVFKSYVALVTDTHGSLFSFIQTSSYTISKVCSGKKPWYKWPHLCST